MVFFFNRVFPCFFSPSLVCLNLLVCCSRFCWLLYENGKTSLTNRSNPMPFNACFFEQKHVLRNYEIYDILLCWYGGWTQILSLFITRTRNINRYSSSRAKLCLTHRKRIKDCDVMNGLLAWQYTQIIFLQAWFPFWTPNPTPTRPCSSWTAATASASRRSWREPCGRRQSFPAKKSNSSSCLTRFYMISCPLFSFI